MRSALRWRAPRAFRLPVLALGVIVVLALVVRIDPVLRSPERFRAGLGPFGLLVPTLAVGSEANVCLADLTAEWQVGESGYESRSSNCAFAGASLTGRVLMTVAGGAVAYRERAFAIGVAR